MCRYVSSVPMIEWVNLIIEDMRVKNHVDRALCNLDKFPLIKSKIKLISQSYYCLYTKSLRSAKSSSLFKGSVTRTVYRNIMADAGNE